MGYTFQHKYNSCHTWHEKSLVLEIYHLAMSSRFNSWTLSDTAQEFDISIGLVSENLRLAQAIHSNPSIIQIETRQKALELIRIGEKNGKF